MPIDANGIKWDDAPSGIKWDDAEAPRSALGFAGNVVKSGGRLVGGLYDAVRHPIDTATGIADAAAGGLRNLVPPGLRDFIDKADAPETTQRISNAAGAVGQVYKDRYGGLPNIARTAYEDPIGMAADVSTVLGGAGGLARMGSRAIPSMGPAADVLSTAAKFTNPMSGISAGSDLLMRKVIAPGAAALVGELGTHTGARSLATAAESGAAGGDQAASFLDNLRGRSTMGEIVDSAKANLQQMKIDKNAQYESNMSRIRTDKSVLDFAGIDKALSDAESATKFKGVVKNGKAAQAISAISEAVDEWKGLNPSDYHTPAGLDALKQKVGAIRESIPFEDKTSRMLVGNVYNAVKNEIQAQAPTYAKTMRDYENAQGAVDEITRALSLGEKASVDTSLRKLQSVMRNNANTNYGNRVGLAEKLSESGGNLMPALAGQSLNTFAPRGLGKLAATANLGAGAYNPALLALLPFQSPRLMGEAAYYSGKGYGLLDNVDPTALLYGGQAGLLGNASRDQTR